jgi:hypothetical protein
MLATVKKKKEKREELTRFREVQVMLLARPATPRTLSFSGTSK